MHSSIEFVLRVNTYFKMVNFRFYLYNQLYLKMRFFLKTILKSLIKYSGVISKLSEVTCNILYYSFSRYNIYLLNRNFMIKIEDVLEAL